MTKKSKRYNDNKIVRLNAEKKEIKQQKLTRAKLSKNNFSE